MGLTSYSGLVLSHAKFKKTTIFIQIEILVIIKRNLFLLDGWKYYSAMQKYTFYLNIYLPNEGNQVLICILKYIYDNNNLIILKIVSIINHLWKIIYANN